MEVESSKRSQWRLSTLLILMLGFALVFAGIAKIQSRVTMEVSFQSLPKSDIALRMWLVEKYRASKITITRPSEQEIAIEFSRPSHSFGVPNPPWDKLAYGRLGSFTFAQSPELGWWIPIGLVVIYLSGQISRLFHFVSAKLGRPRPSDRHPVEDQVQKSTARVAKGLSTP